MLFHILNWTPEVESGRTILSCRQGDNEGQLEPFKWDNTRLGLQEDEVQDDDVDSVSFLLMFVLFCLCEKKG